MHFLLWTKGSHQSPNFDTFKCSGENLPNSSLFSKPQVSFSSNFAWHFSVMKELLSTFLGQTLYALHETDQSKCKFLNFLSAQIKIHQILLIFETTNRFFIKYCVTLRCYETTPRYFFNWDFQQKEPIKVQIWSIFTWAVESLKFCTLMGSFCPTLIKFQLKMYKSYLSRHWRVMQSLKKNWLVVSNMTWGIWWIFIQPLKCLKISLRWGLFVQSI